MGGNKGKQTLADFVYFNILETLKDSVIPTRFEILAQRVHELGDNVVESKRLITHSHQMLSCLRSGVGYLRFIDIMILLRDNLHHIEDS